MWARTLAQLAAVPCYSSGVVPLSAIVLGSASPRRRELLGLVLPAFPFRVVAPDVNEDVRPGERPDAYLTRVVRDKAADVARRIPAEERAHVRAILCADTSVMIGARILGKPIDDADGRAMLNDLSDREHEVCTAFVLAAPDGSVLHEELVRTRVTFRALASEEIDAYVSSGDGRDKAGGYAIQGGAAAFVSRIDGSPTNVIGLPLSEVVLALRRLGLR